jgi:hypothetical protein
VGHLRAPIGNQENKEPVVGLQDEALAAHAIYKVLAFHGNNSSSGNNGGGTRGRRSRPQEGRRGDAPASETASQAHDVVNLDEM